MKNLKLYADLIELSAQITELNRITTHGIICQNLELNSDSQSTISFRASVLAPGFYKGVWISKEDIKRNMNSIFKSVGNIINNELNVDHKNNRKESSSIKDLAGEVINVYYDDNKNELFMDCRVTNPAFMPMIVNKTIKFVSLRIQPTRYERGEDGKLYAREFDLEELSLVRTPGYNNGKIQEIYMG